MKKMILVLGLGMIGIPLLFSLGKKQPVPPPAASEPTMEPDYPHDYRFGSVRPDASTGEPTPAPQDSSLRLEPLSQSLIDIIRQEDFSRIQYYLSATIRLVREQNNQNYLIDREGSITLRDLHQREEILICAKTKGKAVTVHQDAKGLTLELRFFETGSQKDDRFNLRFRQIGPGTSLYLVVSDTGTLEYDGASYTVHIEGDEPPYLLVNLEYRDDQSRSIWPPLEGLSVSVPPPVEASPRIPSATRRTGAPAPAPR